MNKILFTFILILSCDILLSQEEHPNYFPLAVGNKWEYIINPSYRDRLVMTITKDTVMDNDKKYYIFEYNVPATNSMFNYTKYLFTPLDPVRMDENGDIYAYDNSIHNESLYLRFSESGCYQTYLENHWICLEPYRGAPDLWRSMEFIYLNNVGMVTRLDIGDCWGTIWDPCPPFFNQMNILVYAIIDGEKVYSIENTSEYKRYITIYDVNSVTTHPEEIKLHQNYPNPFNPETRIDFEIPKTEKVKLVIYNTLGNEVKTLLNDELQVGKYSTTWNGKDNMNNKVSSGIYFYQLTFGNNTQSITKKLILIK
jgi:hypothetical protein